MKRHWTAFLAILMAAGVSAAQNAPAIVPVSSGGNAPSAAIFTDDCASPRLWEGYSVERGSDARGWLRGEYLLWWFKDGSNPNPLLTTGPGVNGSTPALGQNGTQVLFGGADLDYDTFSGLRLSGGRALGCGNLSLEASGFLTEQRSVGFSAASDANGNPSLARPFINAGPQVPFGLPPGEQALAVSFPDIFVGGLDIRSTSQLWGAEVNLAANIYSGERLKAELLGGFRFLELEEDLRFEQQTTVIAGRAGLGAFGIQPTGFGTEVSDVFVTENRFYGGQVGARVHYCLGSLALDLTGKIALGATRQKLRTSGQSVLRDPNGAVAGTAAGGLLALPTNSGTFEQDDFTVIPELGVNVSYCLGERVRLTAGYSFLYWDNVFRPGEQIDRTVNITQIPVADPGPLAGAARPAPVLQDNDFWAQGINFGLEFRY